MNFLGKVVRIEAEEIVGRSVTYGVVAKDSRDSVTLCFHFEGPRNPNNEFYKIMKNKIKSLRVLSVLRIGGTQYIKPSTQQKNKKAFR